MTFRVKARNKPPYSRAIAGNVLFKERIMAKAVNLPGERLAGLFADLAHKVQHGVISLDEFALFNQRRDPFGAESYGLIAETRLLKPVAKATVPTRTKPFDVAAFYRNCAGLWVSPSFRDRLDVEARGVVESALSRLYVALLLKANACDTDIRKELPETHLSTLEDIASLIEAQPGGKPGLLLNNGYANIFYVEGKDGEIFAVDVYWHSGGRAWFVRDWGLGGVGYWNAAYQALCPRNAVL
jgi:hypothetical protein